MDLTEKKLSSETIYKSAFIKITRDQVELPNTHLSYRIFIDHPGAACVLAITPENKVVLVRQYRYCVGEALLELPAGKIDHRGESPEDCALRELAEETPYTATSVKLLQTFYTAPGFCNEKMHLFLAEGLAKNSQLSPDTDELLEIVEFSKAEAQDAVKNALIKDAKTLLGLNYWWFSHP